MHSGILFQDGEQQDHTQNALSFATLSSKLCVFAEHRFLNCLCGSVVYGEMGKDLKDIPELTGLKILGQVNR